MGFAATTCPPTPHLEALFYANAETIAAAANDHVAGRATGWLPEAKPESDEHVFRGPF
jgi:hypothetical protein